MPTTTTTTTTGSNHDFNESHNFTPFLEPKTGQNQGQEYEQMLINYVLPDSYEWFIISLHIGVFVMGVAGNILVLIIVIEKRYAAGVFTANLSIADLIRVIVCLPVSLVRGVTETWFLGSILCKTFTALETILNFVTSVTLILISFDRRRIDREASPFVVGTCPRRARFKIAIVWIVAVIVAVPESVIVDTYQPELESDTVLFTECAFVGHRFRGLKISILIVKMLVFYVIPTAIMPFAYFDQSHRRRRRNRREDPNLCLFHGHCRLYIAKRKRETKLCASLSVTFAAFRGPLYVLDLILDAIGNLESIRIFGNWLYYLNTVINPAVIVYLAGYQFGGKIKIKHAGKEEREEIPRGHAPLSPLSSNESAETQITSPFSVPVENDQISVEESFRERPENFERRLILHHYEVDAYDNDDDIDDEEDRFEDGINNISKVDDLGRP